MKQGLEPPARAGIGEYELAHRVAVHGARREKDLVAEGATYLGNRGTARVRKTMGDHIGIHHVGAKTGELGGGRGLAAPDAARQADHVAPRRRQNLPPYQRRIGPPQ
jgi:hypothetical protein